MLIAVCTLLVAQTTALDPLERSTAFIGYTEGAATDAAAAVAAAAACRDRKESCEGDASNNLCLLNPYVMRRSCPISCNIEACSSQGTTGQVRRGAASCRPLGSTIKPAFRWRMQHAFARHPLNPHGPSTSLHAIDV